MLQMYLKNSVLRPYLPRANDLSFMSYEFTSSLFRYFPRRKKTDDIGGYQVTVLDLTKTYIDIMYTN